MSSSILTTKLYIPSIRDKLVPRSHLIEKLNIGLARKCTLVSAPAGFGKTTLVSSWLQQIDRPATWLSLDESDNDLNRFLTYLITALQKIDGKIGQVGQEMLQLPQPPTIETLMTTLVNDVIITDIAFILVLDDYHIINNPLIHQGLDFLLAHIPPMMHLVMTSRADPPLALAALRAKAQVFEVREANLRFAADETYYFINQTMDLALSPDDVMALENRTEGWVAGLQLAGLSLQGLSAVDKKNFITTFAGDDRYIVDYLLEEVLHRQPAEVQMFLLQTAILDRLCGPLCDTILDGISNRQDQETISSFASGKILEMLERANLFIIPLDNRRQWYRYHHLFADLLRLHLQETYPDQVQWLHLRASEWYQANGLEEEAIKHALAANDFDRAADLIEPIAQVIMSQGKLFTIRGWLQALPDEIIQSRLRLAVYHLWMLFSTAQMEAAEIRLGEITDVVSRDSDPTFAGEIDALRAFFAYNRGNFPDSIKYAQQALKLPWQSDSFFPLFSTSLLGNSYRLNGDIASAIKVCRELSRHRQKGQRVASAIMGVGNVIRLQMIQGKLREAAQTYEQTFQGQHLQPDKATTPLHSVALIGMGEVLYEWNNLEAAANHLRTGVTLSQRWPSLVEFLIDGVAGLARVLQAQQDIEGAFSLIEEMEQYTNQSAIFQWKLPHLAACRARLWLSTTGYNLTAAIKWADTRDLPPPDNPSYMYEFEYLTLTRVLIAQGKSDDALTLLTNLERAATDAGRMNSALECWVLQAMIQQAKGNTQDALNTITQALSLAEPEGYIRIFVNEGEPMAQLLHQAVGQHIKSDYIRQLLNAFSGPSSSTTLVNHHSEIQNLVDPLSERELDVLRLLNTHLSGPEIATELMVSINTVKTHIKRIYSKLNASNRHEAIERAKVLGLL